MPDAACSASPRSPSSQQPSATWASEVFCQHLLQRRHVQRRFSQKLLQLPVLLLEYPQSARVRDLQAAVLQAPVIERRLADPILPAQRRRRKPSPVLLQNPDDLLFRIPTGFASSSVSFRRTDPTSNRRHFRETGQRLLQASKIEFGAR